MTNTPDKSEMLLPCPFCGVRPVRLKNLDFSNSEAFWHPDDVDCILAGCSIHRDKWEGWNTRASSQTALDEPSIFDFLEPLAEALRKSGGPEIGSYFARATGGVDIEALVAKLAIPPADQVPDMVERAHKAGEKTLRFYIESDHDFSIEYMAMGTVQDALREYRAALNAAALVRAASSQAPSEMVERVAKERADWLLDAIACATQDRRYLRDDPEYDEVAGEAILLNGEKAITTAIAALKASGEE